LRQTQSIAARMLLNPTPSSQTLTLGYLGAIRNSQRANRNGECCGEDY
jgi:hypothetical protein